MSQITLRGNKGSALTYGELDQNFTTIGLTNGMDTAAGNVAISVDTVTATTGTLTTGNIDTVNTDDIDVTNTILINSVTENWNPRTRPIIATAEEDSIGAVAKFVRNSNAVATRSAIVTHTEFGDAENTVNAQSGLGTGFWGTITASDLSQPLNLSGIQSELRGFTSASDYTPVIKLYTYNDGNTLNSVLEASTDEVKFTNTDQVTVDASHLQLKPVAYADLPTLSGSADDGKIAYLTTDGAGAGQYQLIFSVGGEWKYVNDPGGNSVAAS
jgi:hypothetical protein